MNPIEQVYAKLKALIRAAEPRDVETLWGAIGECLARLSPKECANYLANSGYPRIMWNGSSQIASQIERCIIRRQRGLLFTRDC
jgi:hypothetical protein